MSEKLFRAKSLDKMRSPESLNDYVRVTNPGVWLLLTAMILLLAGACVWGIFGHIDSTVQADAHVVGGVIECYVQDKDISRVEAGMTVRIGRCEGTLAAIGAKEEHGYLCEVFVDTPPEDGVYTAEIVIRSIEPISFILN